METIRCPYCECKVRVSDVDADDVSQLGLKQERGARIEDVSDDGPAQKAGLQKDDVLTGPEKEQILSCAGQADIP